MTSPSLIRQAQKIEEYRQLKEPYEKEIAGLTLTIMPNVFPGGTDSALLAKTCRISKGDSVLDVCTGNGVVALSAATRSAKHVLGTDLNPAAIENALFNKHKLSLTNVDFIEADVYPDSSEKFDVITGNIPYTDTEAPDKTAICFWDEGNKAVVQFFSYLKKYLLPEGTAYVTWSSFGKVGLIEELAETYGVTAEKIAEDTSASSGFSYYVYELRFK